MDALPLIVAIKRHSLEDGPGIRSVVFFKGCPLRCVFCHNPETQESQPEIAFTPGECIHCGECANVCPAKAISLESQERIDRKLCNRCAKCVEVCPGKGLRLVGKSYQIQELGDLLLRDRAFYTYSGGGLTLSGGECTLYSEYIAALLEFLKPFGLHVVLETSGFFNYEKFKTKILPYIDMVYFDLKIANSYDHVRFTGRSNRGILRNLKQLGREKRVKVIPRIPLVPNITATKKNLAGIARILRETGFEDAVLMPYNPMGIGKLGIIGKPERYPEKRFMSREEEKTLKQMFRKMVVLKKVRIIKINGLDEFIP